MFGKLINNKMANVDERAIELKIARNFIKKNKGVFTENDLIDYFNGKQLKLDKFKEMVNYLMTKTN
jgi:hypothetical protein